MEKTSTVIPKGIEEPGLIYNMPTFDAAKILRIIKYGVMVIFGFFSGFGIGLLLGMVIR